jgi:hypothetical protein
LAIGHFRNLQANKQKEFLDQPDIQTAGHIQGNIQRFLHFGRNDKTSLGMTSGCNVTLLAEIQPIHEPRKIALSGAK